MRKIYLLLFVQMLGIAAFAQKHEPVNPEKDKQIIEGFTVRLKEAPGNTYLFDVLKDGKPMSIQLNNPFTKRHEGFGKKEDNYKVAKWLISEYKNTGHFPLVIPPHVANELKVSTSNTARNSAPRKN